MIEYIKPQKGNSMNNIIAISIIFLTAQLSWAQQTRLNGVPYAPDERLLEGKHWVSAFTTEKYHDFKPLHSRAPNEKEIRTVEDAKSFFESSSLKALALVDGDKIIWKGFKSPANDASLFSGYSLGKTVTSMVAGKSICAGKISMNTTADSLLPELKGTGYEGVTVNDLLTMRSGIKDGSYWAKGTPEAREKIKQIADKNAKWRDMLSIINKRHSSVFSGVQKSGEKFEYKEIDPLVLGFMLQEAWGERLNTVIDKQVLRAAGFEGSSELQEGVPGEPYAPTIARFTLDNWVRFAMWIKASLKEEGCFGDYVRQATKIQTRTVPNEIGFNFYDGYGYLTWISGKYDSASFWSWGFGGQKIGMNHKNDRILVALSSLENSNDRVHRLYKQWAGLN